MTCKATGESVFYDPDQRALVLKQGHDQRVLVANLNATRYLGWSPNCRTIDGGVQEVSNANLPYDNAPLDDIFQDEASYAVTFWDDATGATLGAILHPYRAESPARVDWSPGGERAFVRSTTGYFIFDPATQEQIPLHYAGTVTEAEEITTYYGLYWDFSNGRIFVNGWGGVLAFDLHTGDRIAFLPPNDFDPSRTYGDCAYYGIGGCSFARSADGRYLYVYGEGSLGQYNFLTLQGVHVDVDNSESVYASYATATSPDGRYLVVGNYELRVWDVAHLPSDPNDRDPVLTFHGPEARVWKIAFVDNTTLAVTTDYNEVSYWNVQTGQQIEQKAQ